MRWTPDRPCCICGAAPTGLYLAGALCAEHAPPAPPVPDPARTHAALSARRGRWLPAVAGIVCIRSGKSKGCHPVELAGLVLTERDYAAVNEFRADLRRMKP